MSCQLTLSVYKVTASFPRDEQYGLTGQIRRACASIPANIAEGCGRGSSAELARFLQIACGSACELECHLLIARDIGILRHPEAESVVAELTQIRRMLVSLSRAVRTRSSVTGPATEN